MQKHDSTACLLIRRSEMPYCTSVRHSNPLGLPRNPWGPEAPPYSAPCAIMPLQAGGPLQSLSNFALGSPMFQRGKQSRAAAKIYPSFETLRTWPGRVHSFQKPRERQADIGSHHAPRDMRRHFKPPISYMATVLGGGLGHWTHSYLENSRSRPGRLRGTRQSFQRRICRVSGSWEETKLAMNCQRNGVRTASGSGQQASLPQAGSLLARHHACREPWIAVRAQPAVKSVNKTPQRSMDCVPPAGLALSPANGDVGPDGTIAASGVLDRVLEPGGNQKAAAGGNGTSTGRRSAVG